MEVGKGGEGDICNSVNNENKVKKALCELLYFYMEMNKRPIVWDLGGLYGQVTMLEA